MSALGDEEAAAQQRCPAPVRRTGADLPCRPHYALRTLARVVPGQGAMSSPKPQPQAIADVEREEAGHE